MIEEPKWCGKTTIDEWQLAPKLWDAVIHLRNGKYGLIEIKLGGDKLIEEGEKV